ncbi:MAG TPA: universal stress protein [Candidatus Binatia bacterium]
MDDLLIAVDDSEASWHAVEQAASLVRGNPGRRVHAFHAIGPVPASLQEFRGAEDPVEERVLEQELKRKQTAWLEKARAAADLLLAQVHGRLEQLGVLPDQITTETATLMHDDDLPGEILRAAQACGCRKILVGRKSFSWVDELLTDHLGERLQKSAEEISVSIVE